MPNASVRANAQSMSRRLFLAAGPATAIFATLRGARGKPVSALEGKLLEYRNVDLAWAAAVEREIEAEGTMGPFEAPRWTIHDTGDRDCVKTEDGRARVYCRVTEKNASELRADIEKLMSSENGGPHTSLAEERAKTLAKVEAALKEKNRLEATVGLPAIRAEIERLQTLRDDLAEEIFAAKANTIGDLSIQAEVALNEGVTGDFVLRRVVELCAEAGG